MMSVLGYVDVPHGASCSSSRSSRRSSSSVSAADGDNSSEGGTVAGATMFEGQFAEQGLTVPQLAELLRRCGLGDHWTSATGLPSPPNKP